MEEREPSLEAWNSVDISKGGRNIQLTAHRSSKGAASMTRGSDSSERAEAREMHERLLRLRFTNGPQLPQLESKKGFHHVVFVSVDG